MEQIGLDIGFGFTKVVKGRETREFKSVYGDAADVQFRENVLDESPDPSHIHIELEDGAYYVGELAERQSLDRYFTLDQTEFVSRFARILALGGLSGLVSRFEPVKLVTGLPVSDFRRHRSTLASALKGTHHVRLLGAGREPDKTVVKIEDVRMVPQPFGTVLDLMLSDIGEVRDTRFLSEKVGIVDIGLRTTDLTVADGGHYAERGSRTIDLGISRALTAVAKHLHELTGVSPELYRLYGAVERGHIRIRGRRLDITDVVRGAFSQLAKSIAMETNRIWTDDWDIDRIVITGGGGEALAPFVAPQLLGEVAEPGSGACDRLSNARGFHKYAMRLWSRGAVEPEADDGRAA